jgi:hypothetical protein
VDAQLYEVTRIPGEIDRILWLFRGIVRRHLVLKLSAVDPGSREDLCFFAHELRPHLYPHEALYGFFPHETATLFRSLKHCGLITLILNPFEENDFWQERWSKSIDLDPSMLPKGLLGDVIGLTPLGVKMGSRSDDRVREHIEECDEEHNFKLKLPTFAQG